MLRLRLIQSQRSKSSRRVPRRQSATPTLPPVPQRAAHSEGEAHLERANPSYQFFHQQARAAGSREGILQHAEWGNSSKEPVIQCWTGNPPSSSQSSGAEQHQGVVKTERISAMKVPRNVASSGAAGNFMPHGCCGASGCCALLQPFYLRRPKEPSNTHDRSGILKFVIP